MRDLGYEPNIAAQVMRSKKSNVIGFLADGVAMSNSSIDLIRGAQDMAWELGKQMMLFNIDAGGQAKAMAETQLRQFRAEAVIYATVYHRPISISSATPRIMLNCYDPAGQHPAFVPDDQQMALDLMRRVFAKGYSRPFFLNLSDDHDAAILRRQGYLQAGRERGLDLSGRVAPALERTESGHVFVIDEVLTPLLSGERPDILICGQDLMAIDVYLLLEHAGLRVGRDIGVASFDDQILVTHHLRPGLSTVALPYYEMGRTAMEAACAETPPPPVITRVPGTFISRVSF
ncbi:LacI family DNA-binding transcriptional regulator [Pararhizobium sp. A13]|uniref:LacI family DNA-binding transcriptional regulator n=1 Tax=Pararhizobium sp. A13 TaxID=3133975 RepID=UPI0032DB3E2A